MLSNCYDRQIFAVELQHFAEEFPGIIKWEMIAGVVEERLDDGTLLFWLYEVVGSESLLPRSYRSKRLCNRNDLITVLGVIHEGCSFL